MKKRTNPLVVLNDSDGFGVAKVGEGKEQGVVGDDGLLTHRLGQCGERVDPPDVDHEIRLERVQRLAEPLDVLTTGGFAQIALGNVDGDELVHFKSFDLLKVKNGLAQKDAGTALFVVVEFNDNNRWV